MARGGLTRPRRPLGELRDDVLIEGVADVGTVEREPLDRSVTRGCQVRVSHDPHHETHETTRRNHEEEIFFVCFVPTRRVFRVLRGYHIRKTPNFGGGIGALNAADRPSASIWRVCAGSMIPSSQSRAVE